VQRHLLFLAITLCGLGSLRADENTRALQARLKEGGFYFGEVNGEHNSETAAAVTRYQIRNGLEISGQLDRNTANSLGISPPAIDAPAPQTNSETWHRLRKSDEQFLKKLDANQRRAPSSANNPGANPKFAQTFVLSRERLRDYVAAFVLAGLDPSVDAELEFFADRVHYFNEGNADREKIRRDLQRYNQRWPTRRFWLDGQVEVQPQPDSRLRVTFPLRYELRNGSKLSSGRVRKTLLVEVTGEDLQIVAVNEQR
jgi:peptidoglycan hydrolase-like protein with peptidoglycan-binding domain